MWSIINNITNTCASIYGTSAQLYAQGYNNCLEWAKQIAINKITLGILELHHEYYIINYPYGATWYKIYVKRDRKPVCIMSITDETDSDVGNVIRKYMGPCNNFHGTQLTPSILGYETLTFEYITGEVIIFESNDILIL